MPLIYNKQNKLDGVTLELAFFFRYRPRRVDSLNQYLMVKGRQNQSTLISLNVFPSKNKTSESRIDMVNVRFN